MSWELGVGWDELAVAGLVQLWLGEHSNCWEVGWHEMAVGWLWKQSRSQSRGWGAAEVECEVEALRTFRVQL